MRKFHLAFLGCLIVVSAAVGQVAEATITLAQGTPEFTQEAMTKRLQALLPALEKVLGSKLPEGVVVRPVTSYELRPALIEESLVFLAESRKGPKAQRTMRRQARALSEFIMGKVSPQSLTILINVGALRRTYDFSVAEGEVPAALLDVILLHEATHVWQDQTKPLETIYGVCSSFDLFRCRSAVCEGHAQWAMRRAAKALGLGDAVAQFDRMVQAKPRLSAGDIADFQVEVQVGAQVFPYVQGEQWFSQAVEKNGGAGAVAFLAAANRPPSHVAQVTGSGGALVSTEQALVPGMILTSLKELGGKRVKFQVTSPNIGAVIQQLGEAGEELKTRISLSLQSFDLAILSEGIFRKKTVIGGILTFADAGGAEDYIKANVMIGKARDKKYSDPKGQVFISESLAKELVLPQGTAQGFTKKVKVSGTSKPQEVSTLFMACGRYVGEVSSFDAGEERAVEVLKFIAQKLADSLAPDASAISGVVVDSSAMPVDQARVALRRAAKEGAAAEDDLASVITDENGGFRFCPIEAGDWEIEVHAPEGPSFAKVLHPLTVTNGTQPEIKVTLPERDTSAMEEVQGQVRFSNSTDVPERFTRKFWVRNGGRIRLVVVEGREGKWKASLPKNLEIMEGLIQVGDQIYADRAGKTLDLSASGLDVEITAPADQVVMVIEDAAGNPLPSARAWYLPSLRNVSKYLPVSSDLWEFSRVANAKGEVAVLQRDKGAVLIHAPGMEFFVTEAAEISDHKVITLKSGGQLNIAVADYNPLDSDQKLKLYLQGKKATRLKLDPRTNSVSFVGVPCGLHRIEALVDGEVVKDLEVKVVAGEATNVEVKLKAEEK